MCRGQFCFEKHEHKITSYVHITVHYHDNCLSAVKLTHRFTYNYIQTKFTYTSNYVIISGGSTALHPFDVKN